MLRYNVRTHRRYPGHEVKGVINFEERIIQDKEFDEHLKKLRLKLEQLVPASLKMKCLVHAEGLTLSAKLSTAAQAQSAHQRLIEYIKSAALALDFRIIE